MTRASRDTETRDEVQRDEPWAPASTLPVPVPMDGWRFKWVRRMSLGETDVMNMSKRRREGWEPVSAEDQPDLGMFSDTPGVIEIGGLVLCKMPEERARSRDRYYADRAKEQTDGLSRQFKSEAKVDARLAPVFEDRKSTVSRTPT
jgi:hypothetical protein